MHYIDAFKNVDSMPDVLKKIDEDKMACSIACLFDKQPRESSEETIQSRFTHMINLSKYTIIY